MGLTTSSYKVSIADLTFSGALKVEDLLLHKLLPFRSLRWLYPDKSNSMSARKRRASSGNEKHSILSALMRRASALTTEMFIYAIRYGAASFRISYCCIDSKTSSKPGF
jgi:hypothetical protein